MRSQAITLKQHKQAKRKLLWSNWRNDQIEAGLAVGSYLTKAAADDVAAIVVAAVGPSVAAYEGVAVAGMIAEQLLLDNIKAGKTGFDITLTLIYDRVYYHADGYYVNCFSYEDMSCRAF